MTEEEYVEIWNEMINAIGEDCTARLNQALIEGKERKLSPGQVSAICFEAIEILRVSLVNSIFEATSGDFERHESAKLVANIWHRRLTEYPQEVVFRFTALMRELSINGVQKKKSDLTPN